MSYAPDEHHTNIVTPRLTDYEWQPASFGSQLDVPGVATFHVWGREHVAGSWGAGFITGKEQGRTHGLANREEALRQCDMWFETVVKGEMQ